MAAKEDSNDDMTPSVKKKDNNIKISVSIPKDGSKDDKEKDDSDQEDEPNEDDPGQQEDDGSEMDPNSVQDDGTEVGQDGLPIDPDNPDSELDGIDGIPDPLDGMEPDPVINDMRDIKLYDLMVALESYIQYFIKAISTIDQSQLSTDQNTKVLKYFGDMKKDLDDLKFYLQNDYESNDYQKNLYTYLLFNKSLAQTVRHVRSTLALRASDLENEEKKQS